MGREVSRDELSKGKSLLGEFARIPMQNSFFHFSFSLATRFYILEKLRGIVRGNIYRVGIVLSIFP